MLQEHQPRRVEGQILSIAEPLSALLWRLVIAYLQDLGVHENAELVWFPQGGLGMLPLQAADPARGYAIRYAPSVRSISGKSGSTAPPDTAGCGPAHALSQAQMRRAGSRLDSGVRPANQIDILTGSDASRDTKSSRPFRTPRSRTSAHTATSIPPIPSSRTCCSPTESPSRSTRFCRSSTTAN